MRVLPCLPSTLASHLCSVGLPPDPISQPHTLAEEAGLRRAGATGSALVKTQASRCEVLTPAGGHVGPAARRTH